MRRPTKLLLGLALIAIAGGLVVLSVTGYSIVFAETDVACGAPVSEAMPEGRPAGLSADEEEYVQRTGNAAALRAHNQDVIEYLEAKACTAEARSRLVKLGVGTAIAWTAGSMAIRSGLRRKPRPPALKSPVSA